MQLAYFNNYHLLCNRLMMYEGPRHIGNSISPLSERSREPSLWEAAYFHRPAGKLCWSLKVTWLESTTGLVRFKCFLSLVGPYLGQADCYCHQLKSPTFKTQETTLKSWCSWLRIVLLHTYCRERNYCKLHGPGWAFCQVFCGLTSAA